MSLLQTSTVTIGLCLSAFGKEPEQEADHGAYVIRRAYQSDPHDTASVSGTAEGIFRAPSTGSSAFSPYFLQVHINLHLHYLV